jgi:flavin reductase (DIM6/NTAB) family NADH-FMN oxidoreductase RutF
VDCINRLSRATGSNPVPAGKALRGYRYEADKFGIAGLTPMASETVAPPRVLECPLQLEATLVRAHSVMADEYDYAQHERSRECTLEGITCLEVRIQRVHVAPSLLMPHDQNRIDPDLWRPMIMSFCRYYGLGPEIAHSKLLNAASPSASV